VPYNSYAATPVPLNKRSDQHYPYGQTYLAETYEEFHHTLTTKKQGTTINKNTATSMTSSVRW
jgi:hypothetical protein